MLPADVTSKILNEGQIIALKMKVSDSITDFYLQVKTKEGPNDLLEFSLGSASAQAVAGTDWDEIQDSSNRYLLEPEHDRTLYQIFYGITPGYARVYRRYPSNVDRGSLLGTRTIGGQIGYINGWMSAAFTPSPLTEFFTIMGLHPSFLGYHPYLEPATITVRMNFFVIKYNVEVVALSQERKAKIITRTMGGVEILQAPQWLRI